MSKNIQIIISILICILLGNIIIFYSCNLLGCYELNIKNIFHLDLLCNACIDLTYTIQQYQMKIYFLGCGYILKKMNDYSNEYLKFNNL